ncbi:hypothetical protein E2542_SST02653 [Spatholobus suberectus]|nr:hypothetical protein E2542_SST02653 [Spatholobus suberectus]
MNVWGSYIRFIDKEELPELLQLLCKGLILKGILNLFFLELNAYKLGWTCNDLQSFPNPTSCGPPPTLSTSNANDKLHRITVGDAFYSSCGLGLLENASDISWRTWLSLDSPLSGEWLHVWLERVGQP